MDIEHIIAKEACIAENEDEMLQGTKYLQSPEVELNPNYLFLSAIYSLLLQ